MKLLQYLKNGFIVILFSWISFFPEPIQARYGFQSKIFFALFLCILLLNARYRKFLFEFYDWPLWLFLLALLSGVICATDKNLAWKTYLYLSLNFLFLFYIGKGIFLYQKDRRTVSIVISIYSMLVALIGILELYFGKNILYEGPILNPFYERYKYASRLMSTQLHPTILGAYLLGCLPFNFYFSKAKSYLKRLLGISAITLCSGVILLTFSRDIFLGFIAMLSFYLWLTRNKKGLVFFLLLLALVITFCSLAPQNTNFERYGFSRFIFGGAGSIISEYRINRLTMTLKILKDYPLFGIGFHHFRLRFNEYCKMQDMWFMPYEFKIPDNMYLTLLAETGIIGLLAFFLFIASLLRTASRQTAPLLALITLLFSMAGYELFYWHNPYIFFCLICGFIQGARKIPDTHIGDI